MHRIDRRVWGVVLALSLIALFLVVVPAPAAPVTIMIPYSSVPVNNTDLEGNPATGAWSDAGTWTIPLENGASAPYGSAQLYAKHNGANIFFRIDGFIDVNWQSATGNHFWLGVQISPTGTSHHSSDVWEGAFFGLWDGSNYAPAPTYPPSVVETTGFSRPPTQNATQSDYGKMAFSGTSAPYAFTAEWKRPMNAGGLALVPDGTTPYHFFVTTDSAGAGSNGGNINHGQITNVNVMRLATVGGGGGATPPAVSITAPANNAIVNGIVTISATASSSAGIARVEFYADTTLLGTSPTAPYTQSWDTFGYANGTHQLTAKAYDPANNVGASAISVKVNHAARSVSITSPANNSVQTGLVRINVSATDPGGVSRVDFYVDAIGIGSRPTAPYSAVWDTTSYADGPHAIRATAAFAAGGTLTASVTIFIDRMPALRAPTVSTAGQGSIRVTWNASSDAYVAGYVVLRSGAAGGPFVQLNANPLHNTTYVDVGLVPGATYYYEIVSVDVWGGSSTPSPPAGGVAGVPSLFDLQNLRWAALPAGMALLLVILAVLVRRELRRRGESLDEREDEES